MHNEKLKIFFINLKEKIINYFSSLKLTTKEILNYSVIFLVAFLVGIIAKKFLKYIILFTILFISIIAILKYYNFINLNASKLNSFLNIENLFEKNSNCLDIISDSIMKTLQKNIIEIILSSSGFILGLKSV